MAVLPALIAVSLLSGLLSAGVGIAGGILPAALLSLVVPASFAVPVLAPIVLAGELAALPFYWRAWRPRHVLIVLPSLLLGTWLGTAFLTQAPGRIVARVLAVVVIIVAIRELTRGDAEPGSSPIGSPPGGALIGLAAGVTSTLAHAGGVLLTIYLLAAGLVKEAFVATVLAILALADVIKLAWFYHEGLMTPAMTRPIALALPFLLLGVALGRYLQRRLSSKGFRQWVAGTLLATGGFLLVFG